MKLTEKEADILACVELRADLPIEQISAETGYQEHTIRYHLHSLEERRIIKRRPFINMARAGYTDVGIYFSPSFAGGPPLDKLRERLSGLRAITWLSELSGDYQFGVAFSVQALHEVEELVIDLSATFPNLFFEKALALQFRAARFPRRYLSNRRFTVKPLFLGRGKEVMTLDRTDCQVLSALAHQDYRSRRQLAQQTKMALSTLDDRVKKLEEKELIAGWVYDFNPALCELQSHTILIFAKGLNPKLNEKIFDFATREPRITFLYSCLGSWDYEINVETADGRELQSIISRLKEELGAEINSVKVVTRQEDLKYSFVPF